MTSEIDWLWSADHFLLSDDFTHLMSGWHDDTSGGHFNLPLHNLMEDDKAILVVIKEFMKRM